MRKPSRKLIGAIIILGLAGTALVFALFPGFGWWPGGTGQHLVLSGTVEATTIPVAAEIAGRVVEIPVSEGELVAPGAVVARLDAAYAEAQVRQAEAAYLAAQARLDEAEAGTRGQQIRQAQAGVEQGRAREGQASAVIEQVRAGLDGAKKHLAYQEKNLADQQKLFAAGVVPAKNVTDATALVDDARAKVQALEAQLTATNGELAGAVAATEAAQAQ
ncbi:MAG: biotin/lipoyl-binding protein, partial [Heliobacteriaceae bacterium]|nr:biotin/lipoyl-binding protein [Heliobacteriaceae bacterium]